MASAKDILARIKEEEIEWVDLRFTDPKGKWQHLTMVSSVLGEDELEDGLMFDGSSIEGWKAINESDMILKPDLDSVYVDPFSATPMLIINCDIVEPSTGELYARDPRSTAKRAEAFLKSTGIGDTSIFRWDPLLGKYVCDCKFVLPGKFRCRGMMESDDLLHWTPAASLLSRTWFSTGLLKEPSPLQGSRKKKPKRSPAE